VGRERGEGDGMRKGVLMDCVFLAGLLDMESGFASTRRAGPVGENPVSGLWDRRTENLVLVPMPSELVK
jgi:hypothetical protein